jgi:hypothetical protein
MKIIDIHTHIGDLLFGEPLDEAYDHAFWTLGSISEWTGFKLSKPAPGFRTFARYMEIIHAHQRNNMATVSNLRKFAKEAGVTHSVVLPIEPMRKTDDNLEDCKKTNADPASHNHKIFTFASVNPRDPQKLEKLHRYMNSGCLGLKIHPIIQNLALTDPAWFEITEAFAQYKKPILIHSGVSYYYIPYFKRSEYGDAATFEKLVAAFPTQVFIMGHCNLAAPETVWKLARKYPNVCADMSFQSAKNILRSFSEIGEDRVLYASDCPFSLPKYAVRVGLEATKSSITLREKFFYKNAESLIGPLA